MVNSGTPSSAGGKAGVIRRRGARFSNTEDGTQTHMWCAPLSPVPSSGSSATPHPHGGCLTPPARASGCHPQGRARATRKGERVLPA
jgi:hypothetical protein